MIDRVTRAMVDGGSQTVSSQDCKSALGGADGEALANFPGGGSVGGGAADGDQGPRRLDVSVLVADPDWVSVDGLGLSTPEDVNGSDANDLDEPDIPDLFVQLAERIARHVDGASANKRAPGTMTIVLSNDAHVRQLNASHRGKDAATNVLSFPSVMLDDRGARYFGDVICAFETVAQEARVQGKTMRDHTVHLIVHGALHLFGFDHEGDDAAIEMENLETRILADFGISNPYAEEHGAPAVA